MLAQVNLPRRASWPGGRRIYLGKDKGRVSNVPRGATVYALDVS